MRDSISNEQQGGNAGRLGEVDELDNQFKNRTQLGGNSHGWAGVRTVGREFFTPAQHK